VTALRVAAGAGRESRANYNPVPRTRRLRSESGSKSYHLLGKSQTRGEIKTGRPLSHSCEPRCMYMGNAAQQRPILGRLCSLFPLMCVCRPHALSLPTARNNKFRSSGGGGGRVNCNLSVSCSAGDEWSYHLCMFSPLRTITSPSPCRTHLHTRERPNLSAEQKQCDNKQQLQSEFLCRAASFSGLRSAWLLWKRLLPRGAYISNLLNKQYKNNVIVGEAPSEFLN
jgi:hypothetical protein